ncbi:MAG: glycosyltransferase family 4 protein [Planctomycetales bacterium]
MNVWLIHLGELLPIDGPYRIHRYGVLSRLLAERGHRAVQWAPTFSHHLKRQRADRDCTVPVESKWSLELLHGPGYRRHVSLRRMRFHGEMARAFARRAPRLEPPDAILCSLPAPEMCVAALDYAEPRGIPVIADVRDVWPDMLVDVFPRALRPVARLLFRGWDRRNETIFRRADAIYGTSQGFLDWGLRYAGRGQRPADRVFPLAYPQSPLSPAERAAAERRWDERGVRDDGTFRVCFLGTFGRLTDPESAVRAARLLKKKSSADIRFVLCGDGGSLARCRKAAAGLDHVLLPGWVDAADATVLLERCRLGVLPYRPGMKTTFPNKLMDYFREGLPVVASRSGELAEFLESHRCAALYAPGDAAGLADAILKFHDSPDLLRERSQAVRAVYAERFEPGRVYGEVIAGLEAFARPAGSPGWLARAA